MIQYIDMLSDVVVRGVDKSDRTGTGSRSIFGYQMRFDLQQGFPLLTTKHTSFKLIVTELLWFLKGNPDIEYLHEHNNHIWDEWVNEDGTFGPIYGKQWRSWSGKDGGEIDQIEQVIETLRYDPNSRRMIVSAWNVAELSEMALPPCHTLFQFYVRPDEDDGAPFLDCQLYQRSADVFLGVPFNIASYSLLIHMIANLVDMRPGHFIWTGGDVHLYHNHFEQAQELIKRTPRKLSNIVFSDRPIKNIADYTLEDFSIVGYDPYPAIKAPIAV